LNYYYNLYYSMFKLTLIGVTVVLVLLVLLLRRTRDSMLDYVRHV